MSPDTIPLCAPFRLAPSQADDFGSMVRKIEGNGRYRAGPFEAELSAQLRSELRIPATHALYTTRTGSDALALALLALEIVPGDEVAVPALAYHAVAGIVTRSGGIPLWTDINSGEWNLSPESLLEVLHQRHPKAVVAVDNLGTPCDVAALEQICSNSGSTLILDACESLRDFPADCPNLCTVWSFSFTKPIHALGMGGALAIPSGWLERVDERFRLAADHMRLPELNAAYLGLALPGRSVAMAHLARLYETYAKEFTPLGWTPQATKHGESSRIHAGFLLDSPEQRADVMSQLQAANIETRVQFPLQSRFYRGVPAASCTVANDVERRVLSFPTGAGLSFSSASEVAAAVKRLVNGQSDTSSKGG
jgi:dTDP-4-amino-4,6-dideoxygalactose transaminase